MTLTAALRAALATPADLEPLRKMSAREGADVAEAYRNLTAALISVALRDADYLVEHVPIILDVLQGAGAPLPDLAAIMREASADPEIPRSAEWTAAALRLAVWADELIFVTVSGTTESLRIYVASVDDVIPWCPADLWDSGDVAP